MDKGWPLALWYVAIGLIILYVLILIGKEVGMGGAPRKPCEGCTDADLGLVTDEPKPAKGAKA